MYLNWVYLCPQCSSPQLALAPIQHPRGQRQIGTSPPSISKVRRKKKEERREEEEVQMFFLYPHIQSHITHTSYLYTIACLPFKHCFRGPLHKGISFRILFQEVHVLSQNLSFPLLLLRFWFILLLTSLCQVYTVGIRWSSRGAGRMET